MAEVNQGGAMESDMIKQVDRNVPIKQVGARKGKHQRAEPAAGLYEQGRVHHVGSHAALEDQMCTFTSDIDRRQGSPDRVDALVWGFSHLLIKKREVLPAKNYHLGGGGYRESLGGGYNLQH